MDISVNPGSESSKSSTFDLANSLTADSKSSSHFIQSVGFAILQAETHFDYSSIAFLQNISLYNLKELPVGGPVLWKSNHSGGLVQDS